MARDIINSEDARGMQGWRAIAWALCIGSCLSLQQTAQAAPESPTSESPTSGSSSAIEPVEEDPWAQYEEETAAPTPVPAPTVTPTPTSTPAAPAAPPPKPQKRPSGGVGLLVAGPLVTLIGVPFSLWGNYVYRATCKDGDAGTSAIDTLECTGGAVGSFFLHATAFLAYGGGVAMTAGGALMRGRLHAWEDVFGGVEPRNVIGFKAGGGVLLGLSAAGLVTARVTMLYRMNRCDDISCVQRRQVISTAMVGAAVIGLGAGASMLAYGAAYDRNVRRYELRRLSLVPAVGPRYGGLQLIGQF